MKPVAIPLVALALALALAFAPHTLHAQERPVVRPELRIDATSARIPRAELSGGAVVPLGVYVRLALTAGAGFARVDGRTQRAGRADAIARFELDPLKQHSRSAYVGAGLSLLAAQGTSGHGWLALVAGAELKERHGWVPSVEVGIGGGTRVAVSIRRAMPLWR